MDNSNWHLHFFSLSSFFLFFVNFVIFTACLHDLIEKWIDLDISVPQVDCVCLFLSLSLLFIKNDLLATLFKSKLLHSEIRFCFLYWIFWETLRPALLPLQHCAAMEYRRLRLLWFAAAVNSAALLILLRCYFWLCNMLLTACCSTCCQETINNYFNYFPHYFASRVIHYLLKCIWEARDLVVFLCYDCFHLLRNCDFCTFNHLRRAKVF